LTSLSRRFELQKDFIVLKTLSSKALEELYCRRVFRPEHKQLDCGKNFNLPRIVNFEFETISEFYVICENTLVVQEKMLDEKKTGENKPTRLFLEIAHFC
jgi:hypothetical protein